MSDDRTLAAASALEKALKALATEIGKLREHASKSRKMIWGLAASVALDVALSIALGFVALEASEASDKAARATSSAAENARIHRYTCEIGNDSRRLNRELWTYVLDTQAPNQTPADRRRVDEFRAYVAKTFAERDCSKLVVLANGGPARR